jgi:hypothetical protein
VAGRVGNLRFAAVTAHICQNGPGWLPVPG